MCVCSIKRSGCGQGPYRPWFRLGTLSFQPCVICYNGFDGGNIEIKDKRRAFPGAKSFFNQNNGRATVSLRKLRLCCGSGGLRFCRYEGGKGKGISGWGLSG